MHLREAAVPVCPPALPKAVQPHNHLRPHGPTFETYRALSSLRWFQGRGSKGLASRIDLLHVLILFPLIQEQCGGSRPGTVDINLMPGASSTKAGRKTGARYPRTAHILWTMHKTLQTQDTFFCCCTPKQTATASLGLVRRPRLLKDCVGFFFFFQLQNRFRTKDI